MRPPRNRELPGLNKLAIFGHRSSELPASVTARAESRIKKAEDQGTAIQAMHGDDLLAGGAGWR